MLNITNQFSLNVDLAVEARRDVIRGRSRCRNRRS